MSYTDFGGASVGSFRALRFPENVATEEVPNYIIFRPEKINFSPISGYGNSFSSRIGGSGPNVALNLGNALRSSFANSVNNAVNGLVGGIANKANNALQKITGGLLSVNFNAQRINNKFLGGLSNLISGSIRIGSFQLQLGVRQARNTKITLGSIAMYMPPKLGMELGVNIQREAAIGAAKAGVAQAIREKQYTSTDEMVSALGTVATGVMADITRSKEISGAFQLGTGRVANPFTYAIFEGVKHRTFSYDFTMVAKNERESNTIKEICDQFMYHMLPQKTQLEDFHFYEVPNQWDIQYYRLGENIRHLEGPKKCFLQDVKIAYGGNTNMSLHNDGSPLEVKLSLTFLEIEPLYRE